MLIESDDVYAIYDGPCNQTECTDAPVSSNCSLLVVCAHDLCNETNCLYYYRSAVQILSLTLAYVSLGHRAQMFELIMKVIYVNLS